MNLATDALRGVALVVLWLPLKLIRFFSAIVVLGTLLDRIDVENVAIAIAAGLVFVSVPRFHRWLRGEAA